MTWHNVYDFVYITDKYNISISLRKIMGDS